MQFVNMFRVDLKGGPAVVPLKQMFYGDAGANRIGAIVTDGGEDVQLSGTCGGSAVLANGGTVALTGVVDGNEAYVELPSAAYAVEGAIQVFVYVEQAGQITTLVAGFGNVRMTDTDTIIDPGTVVPSLAELMSQIAAMEAATVNANAAAYAANTAADGALGNFAPAFAEGTANAAGTYVTYTDGKLYFLPSGHTANATWANTTKTEVTTGGELSDLKSAIGELEVPALPSADGTYSLRLTVSGGAAAYSWAAE